MKKLTVSLSALLFVVTAALTGCTNTASPQAADPTSPSPSAQPGSTTVSGGAELNIKVGTMGTYEPFSYVDENGTLTGYDIEVLRLIEKTDPTLHFEFIAGPWDSLFPGLDSDKFQLLANQITSNPDREAKYNLTDNTYAVCVSQLIVKKGRTDIQSLSDLKDKKIGTTVGDSFTRILEDWNSENGNILNIVYYEEDVTTVLQDIVNDRIDATLNDPIMAMAKAEAQNLSVEPVGERIAEQPVHFISKKDETGTLIKGKLDAALSIIKADGSLSQLSIDWFGVDYSK